MKYRDDKDRIRLNMKIDETSGCWEWQRYRNDKGYGIARYRGRLWRAHRLSYHLLRNANPEEDLGGLCVLHTCDNPGCVNPDHLWLGTQTENIADRGNKGRSSRLRGESCGPSILTDNQVYEIKHWLRGGARQVALAAWFGVSPSAISKINNGNNWGHIKIPATKHELPKTSPTFAVIRKGKK